MGLLPNEFYEMDIEDFSLKAEGFLDHKDWLEASLRRIATIIQSGIPYKNPPAPMDVQWPMRKDAENKAKAKELQAKNAIKTAALFGNNSVNALASFIRSAQGENKKII